MSNVNLDPEAVLAEVQAINPLVFELAMERTARKHLSNELDQMRLTVDELMLAVSSASKGGVEDGTEEDDAEDDKDSRDATEAG